MITTTELVLVICLILCIIALACAKYNSPHDKSAGSTTWDCLSRTGDMFRTVTTPNSDPVVASLATAEHFATTDAATAADPNNPIASAACASVKATNYEDYIRDLTIDDQTKQQHMNFVNDTVASAPRGGLSFSMDSSWHESFGNGVPFVGLMRPQAVPVGNPDSVGDFDMSYFAQEPTLKY